MKYQGIMSDKGISRREAKQRFPNGEVPSFADALAGPKTFPSAPQSLPVSSSLLSTQNSHDKDIMSTLLSQNREILDRLNKVDQIKEKPAQVAPVVEEVSLRELIEAQKVCFNNGCHS